MKVNVQPNDIVAIVLPNYLEYPISALTVTLCNSAACFMNPNQSIGKQQGNSLIIYFKKIKNVLDNAWWFSQPSWSTALNWPARKCLSVTSTSCQVNFNKFFPLVPDYFSDDGTGYYGTNGKTSGRTRIRFEFVEALTQWRSTVESIDSRSAATENWLFHYPMLRDDRINSRHSQQHDLLPTRWKHWCCDAILRVHRKSLNPFVK